MTEQQRRDAVRREWKALQTTTAPGGPTADALLYRIATDTLAELDHPANSFAAVMEGSSGAAGKAAGNVTVREDSDINVRLGRLMRLSTT